MTKARILAVAVCAVVSLCATVAFEEFWPSQRDIPGEIHVSEEQATIPAAIRALRPNFPYSVIPGGVYAPNELRSAMQSDPAVRLHYATFNTAQVHFVTLAADTYRYVSYRVGDQIYWTRKKLRIPGGEVLLTDGKNFARTRCGNRLAERPGVESPLLEPSMEALSQPPFTVNDARPENDSTRAVPESELLASAEELPIGLGLWRYAEGLPNVFTGAAASPEISRSLPGQTMSPWIPPLIVVNQTPIRNSSGGTTPPATVPILPMPVPEPNDLMLISAFLLGVWWVARPRQQAAK